MNVCSWNVLVHVLGFEPRSLDRDSASKAALFSSIAIKQCISYKLSELTFTLYTHIWRLRKISELNRLFHFSNRSRPNILAPKWFRASTDAVTPFKSSSIVKYQIHQLRKLPDIQIVSKSNFSEIGLSTLCCESFKTSTLQNKQLNLLLFEGWAS